MQPFSFRCPHCQAFLRAKDSALVGHNVPCPDCGKTFRLAYDGEHVAKLTGVAENPVTASPHDPPQQTDPVSSATFDSGEKENPWWKEPHVIAWGVAVIFGMCAAYVLATDVRIRRIEKPAANESAPTVVDKTPAVVAPADELDKQAQTTIWNAPTVDTKGQLHRLGQLILKQQQERGHFPQGTRGTGQPTERFSWLSQLAADQTEDTTIPAPAWERSWTDPVNQRFVRQRMPVFLNPSVKQLTGANGFPAGHFVGMAGVGADAATLPVTHERAGIFGYDRQTTVADVKDGLAQTILVAGVQEKLGSWAAGGPATVRGFADEPYINGPDGFGTGQDEGMWVLMADGSVKFRSTDTAAEILRGEAAIADAYLREHPPQAVAETLPPSDETTVAEDNATENEPAEISGEMIDELFRIVDELAQTEKMQQEQAATEDAPPPLTDEQIQLRLDQPVVHYQSGTGATFGPVFEELADMVAVPLDYDAKRWRGETGIWNRRVELEVKNGTVGQVFDQLLESVGLQATIEQGRIAIRDTNKK